MNITTYSTFDNYEIPARQLGVDPLALAKQVRREGAVITKDGSIVIKRATLDALPSSLTHSLLMVAKRQTRRSIRGLCK